MAKNMEYLNGLTFICFPFFGIGKQLDDRGRQPLARLCYRSGAYRSDALGHRTLAGSLGTAAPSAQRFVEWPRRRQLVAVTLCRRPNLQLGE